MGHRVYTIGRDGSADIVLQDASVSRLHAEIIVSDSGGIYLSDRASSSGTFQFKEGKWRKIRSERFARNDRVRFGAQELTIAALMENLPAKQPTSHETLTTSDQIKRDPITGEIIQG